MEGPPPPPSPFSEKKKSSSNLPCDCVGVQLGSYAMCRTLSLIIESKQQDAQEKPSTK